MELRSCYFCGAAGRTVQPRPVSGVDVALCPRCEEKLARLRAASDGEVDATDATPVSFDAPAETDESAADATSSEGADDDPPAPDGAGGRAATDGTTGPAPGDSDENDDGEENDVGDDNDAADDSPSDDPETGVRGLDAAGRGKRSTYRQALRLLRNREFPMARSDTVDLLSSAYDLDREECERLLDLCVDRGLLAEADGELREP